MTARRVQRHALVVALAGLLLAPAPAAVAAPSADLIEATPAQVRVRTPAPGHAEEWRMSVVSRTDGPVALALRVDGASDGLFTGAHPLELRLAEPGGRVLLEAPVADVLGGRVPLDDLPAGAAYELVGTVTLPEDAGNEYQRASGALTVRFTATADDPAPGPGSGVLAVTGSTAGRLALIALAGIAGGTTFLLLRRKGRA